jgi:hypothetical protein
MPRPIALAFTLCNSEGRQTRRDLHLHVDCAGLDPLKGDGRNPLNHARTSLPFCTIRGSRAGQSLQEQYGNASRGAGGP